MLLFIEQTSGLKVGVAEDLMTSHVTWLDVIARCKQELEQDEHRYMATRSIELLWSAVCEVFQLRETADSDSLQLSNGDNIDDDDDDDDDDDRCAQEYTQILQ